MVSLLVALDAQASEQVLKTAEHFCFPVGDHCNEAERFYNAQPFHLYNSHFGGYHLGDDWNAKTGGDSDFGEPVFVISSGIVTHAKDHGGGWGKVVIIRHVLPDGKTVNSLYAHLHKMTVDAGDIVVMRQKIGEIGDANGRYKGSAHLHFEIRRGTTLEMTPGAGYASVVNKNVFLDPTVFITKRLPKQFLVGKEPVVCAAVTGGQHTNWCYSCKDQRDTFTEGQTVYTLTTIRKIYNDHRFRVWAYKNDALAWSHTTGWNHVDRQWGWDRAAFWPSLSNATAGNWTFYLYAQTPDGLWTDLGKASFTVVPDKAKRAYAYKYGGSKVCSGIGGPSQDWHYWCKSPRMTFKKGERVQTLMKLTDIWVDHRFQVRAFKNGAYQWEWTTGWNDVDESIGWTHAYFWPALDNAAPGNWEFHYYVHTKTKAPAYVGRASFTVNP